MKGLFRKLALATILLQQAFGGTAIQTNSFVRHDIAFSVTPLDFAVGEWKSSGESMIAVVGTDALEIAAINFTPGGSTNLVQYNANRATGPIVIGDVDGDGAKDIVFGAGTNVVVRLNTSSAAAPAFDNSVVVAVGGSGLSRSLAVADLDGDGRPDIIYASSSIYALRNESRPGAISFAAPIVVYTNAASFQVADLDGDGRLDIEVAYSAFTLQRRLLLRNTGSVGNINFTQQLTVTTGSVSPTLLEMNGDSKPDHVMIVRSALVFPSRDQPAATLAISRNSSAIGNFSFAPATSVDLDAPNSDGFARVSATLPSFRAPVIAADFNQDGRIDLADAYLTNRLVILENLGLSSQDLARWSKGVEVRTPLYPYEPTIVDINHDGKPDIVMGAGFSKYISIFENQIIPAPEIAILIDPQSVVSPGTAIRLSVAIYHADVAAVDYLDDGQVIASGIAANAFAAQYVPTAVGLHSITARATLGIDAGRVSKPVGLRVVDPNIGNIVALGDGIGSQETFLIFDTGRAFGVGSNRRGQLADPFYDTDHAGFVEIPQPPGAGGWKQISAGYNFVIGSTASNRVFSWGSNDYGQLGRSIGGITNPVPGEIDFRGATIVKVAAGHDFAMALDSSGELYAWGANYYGQLGKGDTASRTTPSKIRKPDGVSRWTDVSVGHLHVLALTDAGQLFGWGWNFWGQAGQPRTNIAVTSPALIDLPPGESAWTNISAGVVGSCAQTDSGRIFRWGNYLTDAGQVSDPTPTEFPVPPESGGFKFIGIGSPVNAALANDSNIYVWGGGLFSPIGLGDVTTVTNPTRLPLPDGVNRWKNMVVAAERVAAVADDGRVFAWGSDPTYALGIGDLEATVPTPLCLPLQSCASNQPPFVKIIHPAFGDVFPANGLLRFEVASDDDDVVGMVRILQSAQTGFPSTTTTNEIARLGFGETNADVVAPKTAFTSLYAVASDQHGLSRTSAPVVLTFPNPSQLTAVVNLQSDAPTNEITGWQGAFAGLFNSSSFRFASVSAILSNLPPGSLIRGSAINPVDNTATIVDRFGVGPRETARFHFEYKLPDGVTNAQVRAYFVIGDALDLASAVGDVQPLSMTILTNGMRLIEFDHTATDEYVVQFTDTLTNWFDAGGFFEPSDTKFRWLDSGPPGTAKHPADTPKRFYRVLRKR